MRENEAVKKSAAGKELDSQARLNIALCKLTTKDYDTAIDQCERVLDNEPSNWKAAFRMASAMYQKNGEFKTSLQGIRTVYNYAKKANQGNPNDKKVKELFDAVKAKYEESQKKEEKPA